jgi:hypothetical protein
MAKGVCMESKENNMDFSKWVTDFNSAIDHFLDALSYVGEFEDYTIRECVQFSFVETETSRKQAQGYLDEASKITETLMSYKHETDNLDEDAMRSTWWEIDSTTGTNKLYDDTVNHIDFLERFVDVIPPINLTVITMPGKQFLRAFKKQCEEILSSLNIIIDTYNQTAKKMYPNFTLNKIVIDNHNWPAQWLNVFNKAVYSSINALSYVDEFDEKSFLSSYLTVSDPYLYEEIIDSKNSYLQAKVYLNNAFKILNALSNICPNPEKALPSEEWQYKGNGFNTTKNGLSYLQKFIYVIPKLGNMISSIKGIRFMSYRKGFTVFKNQCEKLIAEINHHINFYNRYVDSSFKLDKIEVK